MLVFGASFEAARPCPWNHAMEMLKSIGMKRACSPHPTSAHIAASAGPHRRQ